MQRQLGHATSQKVLVQVELVVRQPGRRLRCVNVREVEARRAIRSGVSFHSFGLGAAVFVGVAPLRSARQARYMNEHLPGVHVPDDLLSALEDAGPQDLSFLHRPEYREEARRSAAGLQACFRRATGSFHRRICRLTRVSTGSERYRPFHTGSRFSAKARAPSRGSSPP